MKLIMWISAGCFLGVCAVEDFQKKQISKWILYAGAAVGILERIVMGIQGKSGAGVQMILGMAIGASILVISALTKEQIGAGDGWTFVVLGMFLGGLRTFSLLMTTFFIAGIAALVVLVAGKKSGKYRIPLLPFAGAAFALLSVNWLWFWWI